MVDGNGVWDASGVKSKNPVSVIINWPDSQFTNEDGYFCYDIRKYLGEGANYVRLRSVKEITAGVYAPAVLDVKASYISGWIKD